jgi:DNA topoisomerase III
MKVCIAEKPSVAKEIAGIIGAKSRKDGYFEGNGYQVTWTFGHLCTLKEPHEYQENWKWWNLNTLPILPPEFDIRLIKDKGVEKQFKVIQNLVNSATEIINCGDAGQEGELIQRWVLKLCKSNKPLKRLWISSLTEEAIKQGFKSLKDGSDFDSLFDAGSSRAIGDWLLGMNATRLYTLKFAQPKQVLSIGRVQTPTLALIVNRQLEIENFKSQTYWELKTNYRNVIFSSDKGKFADNEKAQQALKDVSGQPFKITSVETKKGKEAPPRLFDLTSLQVECNKKIGLSADDTLKTVQGLYEKKFVTYPRVDTTYLSNDLYPKIKGILQGLGAYSSLTAPLINKPIKKTSKIFNDNKVTDHHAIIPTGIAASGLSNYEMKVYDMITRRFIAAFYPDCEVSNTVVLGEAGRVGFKTSGRQILSEGWRVVFGKEDASVANENQEQDEEQLLPVFKVNEEGPHEPVLGEKQTQPPKPYTEATLLRAMESAGKTVDDEELRELMKDNGIGRPSTRAAIIETLFRRNYIKKERKNLIATPTGVALIRTINNELLKSAELTGQWEFKLRQIEKGQYSSSQFLLEMRKMILDLVTQVIREPVKTLPIGGANNLNKLPEKVLCPKCGKDTLVKGKTAVGCSDFSACGFKIPFESDAGILSPEIILRIIAFKEHQVTDHQLISGKKTGILKLIDNNRVEFIEEKKEVVKVKEKQAPKANKKSENSSEKICPKCMKGNLLKGNAAFGCSMWKSGCDFRIPFNFMGKTLTDAQLVLLLNKKQTKPIKGLKNSSGQSVDGKIILNNSFQLEFVAGE